MPNEPPNAKGNEHSSHTTRIESLRQIGSYLNRELAVDESASVRELDAETLYQALGRPGGNIELAFADNPYVSSVRPAAILNDTEPIPTCGIDAGLTTALELPTEGGQHAINMASAVADSPDPILRKLVTNVGVVATTGGATELEETELEDGLSESFVVPVTESERLDQPRKLVTDYARALAEGRLLKRVSRRTSAPVFLDGPGLPLSSVLNDYVFQLIYRDEADDEDSTLPTRILQNYITGIDHLLDNRVPFFGFVKSSMSRQLLSAIEEKLAGDTQVPWTRDMAFIEQLCRQPNGHELRYTPWFLEREYTTDIGDGHSVSLTDGVTTGFPDEEYRRMFCYVRLPDAKYGAAGTVIRVETVAGALPDQVIAGYYRQIILAELSRTGDVPEAVQCADERARISRERRQALLEDAGLRPVRQYDRDHRGYSGGES